MSKKILKRTKVPHLNIIKLKVESKVEKNKKSWLIMIQLI